MPLFLLKRHKKTINLNIGKIMLKIDVVHKDFQAYNKENILIFELRG